MVAPVPAAHVVRLVAFPRRLFAAADEQWEGLLREYTLRGMGGSVQTYRADEVGQASDALREVADAAAAPMSLLAPHLELEVSHPGAFTVLQAILDDCRRLTVTGELLMLPSLPEVVALRDWICGEVIEQAAGADPRAWRLHATTDPGYETGPAQWDPALAPPPQTAWLVGDDRNRIVAASAGALRLLGWDEQGLVGQRLLTVIPHHLREAHIAGFTRSVVSGDGSLLGRPLALPALTSDGREVPVTLTLTRHPARGGRHVYLALLDPAPDPGGERPAAVT